MNSAALKNDQSNIAQFKGLLPVSGILACVLEAKANRVLESKSDQSASGKRPRSSRPLSSNRRFFIEAIGRDDRVNIIAEIKCQSPSKGIIREEFDPVRIARAYVIAGVAAISVLTEEDFFGGSLTHLRAIRGHLKDALLLRKDFIFDECQLYESWAAGADAVLLITTILSDDLLTRLIRLARELGLEAIVEAHTRDEVERACRAGALIIGINNRDLINFSVDIETSLKLAPVARPGTILISESGINNPHQIQKLKQAGYKAFLIGEYLMRQSSPDEAVGRLIDGCNESVVSKIERLAGIYE
jgi:indole-3-glycerol phosphate synthase